MMLIQSYEKIRLLLTHQLFSVNAQSENSHDLEWWGFAGRK